MPDNIKDRLTLRRQVHSLTEDIYAEIHHGECFYEQDMLDSLCTKLDQLKDLAQACHKLNQEDDI